jgi:hypothetical protein
MTLSRCQLEWPGREPADQTLGFAAVLVVGSDRRIHWRHRNILLCPRFGGARISTDCVPRGGGRGSPPIRDHPSSVTITPVLSNLQPSAPGAGLRRPGGVASTYMEVPAMTDPTRPTGDVSSDHGVPDDREIPLARDLTDTVIGFVHDRVTPIAEWVTWTGGDPGLVLIVVTDTLRSIADGLEPADVDARTGG